MSNLQEVTGVNFEIALEKFQQDLEDITRNQKSEVSLDCFCFLMDVPKTFGFEFRLMCLGTEERKNLNLFVSLAR